MKNSYIRLYIIIVILFSGQSVFCQINPSISGRVISDRKEPISFATIHLKGTSLGTSSDEKGYFSISAPKGNYTLVATILGYKQLEIPVEIGNSSKNKYIIKLSENSTNLDEVVVTSTGVNRIKRSAYNAIALDTKALENSTQNLSDALSQAPGIKLRQSGGVGSDMQLLMDGFSGKHIKIFIDGVPQEGVGNSFSLNNIPANFAERIEVYKGVVPVGFGTDAIGGVINIVTKKNSNRWYLDASYSFGSFNTHKSYFNFGQTLPNGFTYEINAFANYSDNNYRINTPVKDFSTGAINKKNIESVRRFHDTYHNEAIVAKLGFVNKLWTDRFILGFTYSRMHKDIQTGVRQEIVFGGKYRNGYSLMPSLEYHKRNLIIKGLDVTFTANYNKNITNNVDTANYEYNWRGEMRPLRLPGEQSYQFTHSSNNNWNSSITLNYRVNRTHLFTFNNVFSAFQRNNQSLLTNDAPANAIDKKTKKNIGGISYRFMPSDKWNVSVFGKYYHITASGPVAESTAQDKYIRISNSINALGYGAAGTYYFTRTIQAKLSYEKSFRLPTIEEMFGDEDLENGDVSIKPERSDNINLNISTNHTFGNHNFYAEGGLIYRNTQDYIQRNITSLGGGKYGAAYVNHGKVRTEGFNISLRYAYSNWVSLGGTFNLMNVRDRVRTISSGTSQESLTFGARMPNLPYCFANSDINFFWNGLGGKNNKLTVSYDNMYLHSFPLYSEAVGSESSFIVPTQFAHNISFTYSMNNGRYNVALECNNITNEKLYDNFSLQKAGRAFYGKVRIYFGSK